MSKGEFSAVTKGMEVNFKSLIDKVLRYKFWFLISIPICLGLAFVYVKLATPVYEVKTSLLIDPTGKSRQLGESQYIDGGVGALEAEKNIFNEIGIIRSYGLIEETVKELKFDVSYHTSDGYRDKEHYGYFPVEVQPDYSKSQLYNIPFYFEILSDSTFRLKVEAEEFVVSNPATDATYEVNQPLNFSGEYKFNTPVSHDYFHFTVRKPEYEVIMDVFNEEEIFFKIHQIRNVANGYISKLEVSQKDIEGSILDLRTAGEVVEKEVDFLNKLTENYIAGQLSERDRIALNKEDFIRNQLASIADSLARAERSLEAFRRNTRAVDLTQTASNALNQAQSLQADMAQMELNMKYYQTQLETLQDSSTIDQIIAPSVVGINDPMLNENLLELKRLYSEKTRLNYFKGNQSLDLEILNKQIANTTKSLESNLRNLIQSSQLGISDIQFRLANLETVINQLPSNEKQLLSYQRKSSLYENLFNYLNQELAKTGIAKAEDIPDTKVLDEARMAGNGPIAPQKKLIFALAFIVGLTIPLGWIILHDSIDETIYEITELENYSNFPVAASIASDNSNSLLSVSELSEWRVEESFRDLTASIQFLIPDSSKNVIGITSTIPGEGKSFCSVNLAVNFAKGGKKVLLIDSDFRKPSLLEISNDETKKDFSYYLGNPKIPVESIIHEHPEISNFHYVPTEVEEKNPHILLSSPRFTKMLEELKGEYDYIIIDSPAIGLVSDYLLMSKSIDIHLFIVRRNISKISFLKNLDKLKRSGKLKNIYLVFNGAVGKSFKYGYSRYDYSNNKRANNRFGFKSIKNWLF